MSDLIIDATNPDNLSNKILPEDVTRRKVLNHARKIGCEIEVRMIFDKYDKLLRNCSNQKEAKEIGKLGIWEIYRLFDSRGKLYVNNKLVNPEDEEKLIL